MSAAKVILVTGSAGYIGSHFCAELQKHDLPYLGIDNLSRGHLRFAKAEKLIVSDIDDRETIVKLCVQHGVDTIVHFAAYAYVGESTTDPALYYNNNLSKSISLMDAARAAGVKNIVFSSSCTTYGTTSQELIDELSPQAPENPYGDTKLAFERLLANYYQAYGIRYAILRYFNAAGAHPTLNLFEDHDPETHLIPLAIRAADDPEYTLPIFGNDYGTTDGTCVRDYVHVSDLADAHIRALNHLRAAGEPLVLNLGVGRGYSVLDVIRSVERLGGKPVKYSLAARRPGDAPSLVANPARARSILGWVPRFSNIDLIVETALLAKARRDQWPAK